MCRVFVLFCPPYVIALQTFIARMRRQKKNPVYLSSRLIAVTHAFSTLMLSVLNIFQPNDDDADNTIITIGFLFFSPRRLRLPSKSYTKNVKAPRGRRIPKNSYSDCYGARRLQRTSYGQGLRRVHLGPYTIFNAHSSSSNLLGTRGKRVLSL